MERNKSKLPQRRKVFRFWSSVPLWVPSKTLNNYRNRDYRIAGWKSPSWRKGGWLRRSRKRTGGRFGLVFGVSRQTARERHKRESLKGEEGERFERFCRQDADLEIRVNYLISWKINCIAS